MRNFENFTLLWSIPKFFNINSNFASAAKDSSPIEKPPYICGLRARIGCEPFSEHPTRSDRVTDIGWFFYWGASTLPCGKPELLKVFYTAFKNLLVLFCINILSNIFSDTFGMCHLTKYASIWTSDTFDSVVRTIWIIAVIHCRFSV